jgi:flagellar biosynthesis/type III secretory pathway M-ring protein FliF/YscJ
VDVLLVIVVLAVAVMVIVAPLRRRRGEKIGAAESAERAELEAAKEAKYREIREAELDHRTGKLSREDWRAFDAELRAEAIELLRRLDAFDDRDRDPDEQSRG